MPDFHCELYQLLAADLSNRRAAFVIKQKKLLPSVNTGDLIETDTGAAENWTVNHSVPAEACCSEETFTDIDRKLFCLGFFFRPTFALIGHYRKLSFISIPIFSTSRCSCPRVCFFGNGCVHSKKAGGQDHGGH